MLIRLPGLTDLLLIRSHHLCAESLPQCPMATRRISSEGKHAHDYCISSGFYSFFRGVSLGPGGIMIDNEVGYYFVRNMLDYLCFRISIHLLVISCRAFDGAQVETLLHVA